MQTGFGVIQSLCTDMFFFNTGFNVKQSLGRHGLRSDFFWGKMWLGVGSDIVNRPGVAGAVLQSPP